MRRRAMPSPAMVIALIALFVALGGTGYAATSLSDNGSSAVAAARRHRRSLRGPRGFRGRTGPQGPVGPQGPQGPQGPAGTAKAFAEVSGTGLAVAGHASNIANANVTHPATGIYCFDLSGIGITALNAAPLATADYSDGSTLSGDTVQVVANTTSNGCPSGQVSVRTYNSAGSLNDAGFVIAFM